MVEENGDTHSLASLDDIGELPEEDLKETAVPTSEIPVPPVVTGKKGKSKYARLLEEFLEEENETSEPEPEPEQPPSPPPMYPPGKMMGKHPMFARKTAATYRSSSGDGVVATVDLEFDDDSKSTSSESSLEVPGLKMKRHYKKKEKETDENGLPIKKERKKRKKKEEEEEEEEGPKKRAKLYADKVKTIKTKGVPIETRMKYYERNSGKIFFSLGAIDRLFRQALQKNGVDDARISKHCIGFTAEVLQLHLIERLKQCKFACIHDGNRVTLMPKDFKLVEELTDPASSKGVRFA